MLAGSEWDEIKGITKQVVLALKHLHTQGCIHGDLKRTLSQVLTIISSFLYRLSVHQNIWCVCVIYWYILWIVCHTLYLSSITAFPLIHSSFLLPYFFTLFSPFCSFDLFAFHPTLSILLYPATTAIAAAASNIIQVAQRIKLIDLDASANFFKVREREAAGRKCDAIRIDESSSERSSHKYCYTAVLSCPVLSATFSLSLSLTVYLSLSLSLFVSLSLCHSLSLSLSLSLTLSVPLSFFASLSVCLSLSLSLSLCIIWFDMILSAHIWSTITLSERICRNVMSSDPTFYTLA